MITVTKQSLAPTRILPMSPDELMDRFSEFVHCEEPTFQKDLFSDTDAEDHKNRLVGLLANFQKCYLTEEGETGSHIKRVTVQASVQASLMHLPSALIERAATLHDFGKIMIPSEILNKPGALTPEERGIMQQHTTLGEAFVSQFPALAQDRVIRSVVRSHHERWDGAGYPDALTGAEIPVEARLFALCDVYDALRWPRCYRLERPRWDKSEVIDHLRTGAGTQFDPDLTAAFLQNMDWIYSLAG